MSLQLSKYESLLKCDTQLEMVEVLHGSLDELTKDEVKDLTKKYAQYLKGEFHFHADPYISFEDTIFYFYSPYKFTFGEFIDLHEYRKQNDIVSQLTMVFRRCNQSDIFEDAWEDYGDWVSKRRKYVAELDVENIGGHLTTINTYYNEVIKGLQKEADDQHEEELSDKEEEDKKKEEVKESFFWEHSLYTLCNGDVSKFESVLKMNAIMVFNVLKMKKTLEI